MKRTTLLVLPIALVVAAFWMLTSSTPDRAARVGPTAGHDAPVARIAPLPALGDDVADRPAAERTTRSRFKVEYTVATTIDGSEGPGGTLEGLWTTEPMQAGRVRAALSHVEAEGHALFPTPDALNSAVEMVADGEGRLVAMGFAPQLPNAGKRMFTTLATSFWHTPNTSGDATWTVEEEEMMGTYTARYETDGDDGLTRTVERFTGMRLPNGGLSAVEAGKVRPDTTTRFAFDDNGLVSAKTESTVSYDMGESAPEVVATISVRFVRLDQQTVLRKIGMLNVSAIGLFVDQAKHRATIDDQLVDGASAAELIAEAVRVGAMNPNDPDYNLWRAHTVRRLAALVRLDPATADALAAAVRKNQNDMKTFTLLTGGISSANTAHAASTLAGLMDDDSLAEMARRSATDHLALIDNADVDVAEALAAQLDGDLGPSAATALGAQAKKLADVDPEAAQDAVDALMERHANASDDLETLETLRALGNSGDNGAFDTLAAAANGDNPLHAEAAVYGLRHIESEQVDALLNEMLQSGDGRVAAAVRAAEYRDQTQWRATLESMQGHADESVRNAVRQVLGNWNSGSQG